MALQIEDILGAKEQPNLPGTIAEHPNWCRRVPVTAQSLGQLPALQAAGEAMEKNERRRETWTS